jgi:hypothetical protein
VAVGVAGAAVAAGAWIAALDARETYLADRSQDNYDHATALETATNVGWAVAAVGGSAGVAMLIAYGATHESVPPGAKANRRGWFLAPSGGGLRW